MRLRAGDDGGGGPLPRRAQIIRYGFSVIPVTTPSIERDEDIKTYKKS
jgi:hypothetical protein